MRCARSQFTPLVRGRHLRDFVRPLHPERCLRQRPCAADQLLDAILGRMAIDHRAGRTLAAAGARGPTAGARPPGRHLPGFGVEVFLMGALAYARAPDRHAQVSIAWMAGLLVLSTLDVALGLRTLARLRRRATGWWVLGSAAWGALSTALVEPARLIHGARSAGHPHHGQLVGDRARHRRAVRGPGLAGLRQPAPAQLGRGRGAALAAARLAPHARGAGRHARRLGVRRRL